MKKLYSIVWLALFVVSCSSSDSATSRNIAESILIKRTIQTTIGSSDQPIINDFTYDGYKLTTITGSSGVVQKFFYTGDLITRVETYADNSGIPVVLTFSYNNGKLMNRTRTDNVVNQASRIAYTYNDDGTISLSHFSQAENSTEVFDYPSKYFMTSTNEIQRAEDYDQAGTVVTRTTTFAYDNKHNPFKNILGWSKLLYWGGFFHNVTAMVTNFGAQTSTYQYNGNEFPTSETRSLQGNADSTIIEEYIYE